MDALSFVVLAVLLAAVCCEAKLSHEGKILPHILRQSYKTNIATFIFNNVTLSLFSVSSLLFVASEVSHFGLLNLVGGMGKVVLSFVLLDVTLYLWHRACHKFEWLWQFHKIHHSDLTMNVTTAFRVHVLEVFLTTVVKTVFIIVMGVDALLLLVNETVITVFVIFHHSNMAFRREKILLVGLS